MTNLIGISRAAGNRAFAATGTVPILNQLASSVQAAYSFRKLRTAYAGSAVQIFRLADSALLDIGFVGGLFDTAAYTTFIGGGTGLVNIWYDQSGNGRNATKISVNAVCSLTAINSIPGIFFSGGSVGYASSSFVQSGLWTTAAIAQSNTTAGGQIILKGDNGSTQREAQYMVYNSVTNFQSIAFDNAGNPFFANFATTLTNANVLSVVRDGTSVTNWVNGTIGTPAGTTGTPAAATFEIDIGGDASSSVAFSGSICEVILLGAASTADRALMETSQRAYAGI